MQLNRERRGLETGEVWALLLLDEREAVTRSMIVRVSEKPARSCRGGNWNQLEVLSETPRPDPRYRPTAAYEPSGAGVNIDLAIDRCDGYVPLHGELSAVGMQGTHGTFGLDGSTVEGKFYGTRLPPAVAKSLK